jgi:hypothetical protein
MAEMILPGTYIEVRPEGLIAPGRVTVGNLGVVGTAAKGPIGAPVILGSYTEAVQKFYEYDAWIDGTKKELTLVRALEQAFAFGATTVFALRVTGKDNNGKTTAKRSSYSLKSATGTAAILKAKTEGKWGDDLGVNVTASSEPAVISDEQVTAGGTPKLKYSPVLKSARNRISVRFDATGITRSLQILYDDNTAAPKSGEVKVTRSTGALAFGDTVTAADKVTASYLVNPALANPADPPKVVKVTLRLGQAEEVYIVVDGQNLIDNINRDVSLGGSAWVVVDADDKGDKLTELPSKSVPEDAFAQFTGGSNGEDAAANNYEEGLEALLNEEVHIIVAAGQDDSFGNKLDKHCQLASTDTIKHDRIAVTGCKLGATVDDLRGHNIASDRVIFVAPGIKATDAGARPPKEVTLPGAYAAAAVAGLLASFSAHISMTNKTLSVDGLEQRFTSAELTQLIQSRVLALEQRQGFRIVKGVTTSTGSAFAQITTRRIVDFAKFGVRSAASPYIGLLNNERVRGAMRATINSFLTELVQDEMLVSYELEVTATRDEERKGIARVTLVLRPTFSIDFIKVTMFLE